jgi:hypothetical protein
MVQQQEVQQQQATQQPQPAAAQQHPQPLPSPPQPLSLTDLLGTHGARLTTAAQMVWSQVRVWHARARTHARTHACPASWTARLAAAE